jgi:protein-S-isoprenylcysteine O-methyltransferase Ste14
MAVAAFWGLLALVPELRTLFVIRGAGDSSLIGFAAADITIVSAAAAAAIGVARGERWAWLAMLLAAATAAYPALYSLAGVVAGLGGELSALLMLPVPLVNLAFAVAHRPASRPPVGRPARRASASWNLLKTLGELAFAWTVFVWLLPSFIGQLEAAAGWSAQVPEPSLVVGAGLVAVGGAGFAWSALFMARHGQGTPFPFDAPRRLVLDGPYRFVRNPQVVGGLCQGVGLVCLTWSPLVVGYVVAGAIVWQLVLRPWEEAALLRRFGSAYEDYRQRVDCWCPRCGCNHRLLSALRGRTVDR